ncbi:MAG: hypothetical protein AAF798_04640 [Bacteroidota bacterium]
MSVVEAQARKLQLIEWLAQLEDIAVIEKLQQVKEENENQSSIIGYRVVTGEPVYAHEAEQEFKQILDEVKQGDYITIDELIKERSAEW